MSTVNVLWLTVFVVAAALFFVTAVVITVVGVRDLRELLSTHPKRDASSQPR